jgi:hypothetical protein
MGKAIAVARREIEQIGQNFEIMDLVAENPQHSSGILLG